MAALDIGSNVILTGPPGSGKTTLAYLAAELGRGAVRCTGFQPVTATSDWNTDITIGRYESNEGGRCFQPGIFLEAIQAGRWLVVDELNRSDFDRAFGQLFTVLAGQSPLGAGRTGAPRRASASRPSGRSSSRSWRAATTTTPVTSAEANVHPHIAAV